MDKPEGPKEYLESCVASQGFRDETLGGRAGPAGVNMVGFVVYD